jgi:hypothetical protein
MDEIAIQVTRERGEDAQEEKEGSRKTNGDRQKRVERVKGT